jgi:hypothetical protein
MVIVAVPVFFKVTEWMVLDSVATTLPKATVVAETVVCAWPDPGKSRQNMAVIKNTK